MNVIQGKTYRFTLITDQLIRLEYSEAGCFEDAKTQTVLNRDLGAVKYELIEDDERLEIITEAFHLYYRKGEFSGSQLFIDVRYNFSAYHNRWYYGSSVETLKGTARTLDEVDGATPLGEGIISKQGYAILDDSQSFILDEYELPQPRVGSEVDLYFFAYGRDYLTAVKDFYRLTGATPLLPRYALGNWWSRFWRYDEAEYLQLMDRFKEEEVPLSVSVIDMDWHLTDVPERFGSGWTGYTWNRELFPNPKGFLDSLHDRGLTASLNVHPADGIRAFEESYERVAKRLDLNVALEEPATFNIANEKFRESYFEDVHHPLEADGVDFWWIDWQQGTESGTKGLDPLWLLNHFHYLDVQRKGKGDIILSRYAGPGSHRYPIGFSGDTVITWESLDFQPYFTSTAANIGYSWWSHDIGGHMQGYSDSELALRWLQYGVFSPINRLHSSNSLFTGKEPWRYPAAVCQSMKEFLRFRHGLIPYLYTMNVRTHEEGLPLVLPMYYYHPMDEQAYEVKNQYYFGTEMMVAPITKKADSQLLVAENQLWLPDGVWYDYFTGYRYQGNTTLKIYRSLEQMPVFVKEGAIIPLAGDVMAPATDRLPEVMEWHLFPGKNHEFELVEDLEGKRVLTTCIWDWESQELKLEVKGDMTILPKDRKHKIVLHSMEPVDTHVVNDGVCMEAGADKDNSRLQHFLIMPDTNLRIAVQFTGLKEVVSQNTSRLLYEVLDRAEIDYTLKDYVWQVMKKDESLLAGVTSLNQLENKKLADVLFEILYLKNS